MSGATVRAGRAGRAVRTISGLVTALGFTVGLPMVLTRLFGSPLAHLPGSITAAVAVLQRPVDDRWVITALTEVVWACWAVGVYALLAELLAELTGHRVRLPAPRPARVIAATLIGSIGLLLMSLVRPETGHAAIARPAAGEIHTPRHPAVVPTGRVVRVRPGNSLWTIAEQRLGASRRWSELWRLNHGRLQADGHRLRSPGLILPGWRLQLPAHARPPGHGPAHPTQPTRGQRTQANTPGSGREATTETPRPDAPGHACSPGDTPGSAHPPHDATAPGRRTSHENAANERHSAHRADPRSGGLPVALVAAIGAGVIAGWGCARGREGLVNSWRRIRPLPGGTPPGPETAGAGPDGLREAEQPGYIVVAERDGTPVGIDLRDTGGLGVVGPVADDVLRAVVFRQLVSARDQPVEFWTHHHLAVRLIPAAGAEEIPGMRIAATPADLARDLEVEVLRRARLAADTSETWGPDDHDHGKGANGSSAYGTDGRTDDTDRDLGRDSGNGLLSEEVPCLVVLTDREAAEAVTGPAYAGRRLGVTALATGPWPHGLDCQIDSDAHITDVTSGTASGGTHQIGEELRGARLRTLAAGDATHLAVLLPSPHAEDLPSEDQDAHESDNDHDTPVPRTVLAAPPQDSRPEATAQVEPDDAERDPAGTSTAPPATADPVTDAAAGADNEPAQEPAQPASADQPPQADPAGEQQRLVELRVLGPVTVMAAGRELVTGLRRDSRDLLAYLGLYPDGARTEQIYADLWPDTDPANSTEKLRAAVRTARSALRQATGATSAKFLLYVTGRYRLDQNLIGVDLRRFQAAATAATHGDDEAKRAWLEQAADLYAGEALCDMEQLFAEEVREAERRRVLTVLTRLADLTAATDPEPAIHHLERACDLDPYSTHLYDRLITIHQRLGRLDAADRTRRLRDARLTDLDSTN